MSALPPKADIEQRGHDVRYVPKADIGSAHLITSSASLPRASTTHVKFVASLPAGHIQHV